VRGEWATWAGEAAPGTAGLPLWLAIVLSFVGLLNTALLGWLGYLLSRRGHELAVHQSYRDLIIKAAELIRSPEHFTHEQGMAMLESIAQIKGLSADDVRLIQLLTRQGLERRLDEGRQAQQQGRKPRFWRRRGGGRQQR
jgi:hypothetical protein